MLYFVVYCLWIVNENGHTFQKDFSSECLSSRKAAIKIVTIA